LDNTFIRLPFGGYPFRSGVWRRRRFGQQTFECRASVSTAGIRDPNFLHGSGRQPHVGRRTIDQLEIVVKNKGEGKARSVRITPSLVEKNPHVAVSRLNPFPYSSRGSKTLYFDLTSRPE
jgi:hypothetical protein